MKLKQIFQRNQPADVMSTTSIVGISAGALLSTITIALCALSWYVSREPEMFDVRDNAKTYAAMHKSNVVTGTTIIATLDKVASTLLEKPGGYLSNDVMPPGVLLDNMPNWEFGVLVQVRDLSKAMRESLSRSQTQSTEDPDLAEAEPRFNFDSNSWALPASESEYRSGIGYLRKYMLRLDKNQERRAQLYARADNLRYWLGTVEARLGSLSQRLSASVGQQRINTDLAGDPSAKHSTSLPAEEMIQTPWYEIDDVFYEARGTTWALAQFLKAIEVDFADVLANKNAHVSLQQIIRELEATQQPIMSPVIMNGDRFGLVANHSLVMASYISRANAAIIELRELLSRG